MIWKKFIVIFMVCLIVSSTTVEAHAAAEAGVLSIVGGSVAAGGIGATIAAIAPPVAVIVGLALAAQGVYVALSDASEAAGMTKTDYIGTKLSEWALASGKQYSDVCQTIADGTQITTSGNMILSGAAADVIYQFFNSINESSPVIPMPVGNTITMLNGVEIPVVGNGEMINVYKLKDGTIYSLLNLSGAPIALLTYAISSTRIAIYGYGNLGASVVFERYFNGTYANREVAGTFNSNGIKFADIKYNTDPQNVLASDIDVNYLPFFNVAQGVVNRYVSALNGQFATDNLPVDLTDGIYGDNGLTTDILDLPSDKSLVINPGLDIPGIEQEYGKTGTISIDNYLQTLQRALDGVQDNTLAISNTLTGVLETVAVGTYDPVGSATTTQEDTAAIPEVLTPVIDVALNPTGSAAENNLKGMQFDLTSIFPFCIPFDIVALIQKFDVQPETPAISLSLPLPGVNTTLDLDLDLAPFETVARILRTMELIAFILGLMMVTRHLIRG